MHIELHFSSLRALNLCGLLLTEHEGEHTRDPALTERRTPPAAHRESPANQPSAGPGSRRGATARRTPGRAVSTSATTRPSGTLSDRRAPVRRDGTCRTQRASVCKMQECASRGLFMTNFRIPTAQVTGSSGAEGHQGCIPLCVCKWNHRFSFLQSLSKVSKTCSQQDASLQDRTRPPRIRAHVRTGGGFSPSRSSPSCSPCAKYSIAHCQQTAPLLASRFVTSSRSRT